MKVLVLGAGGQLGQELVRARPAQVTLSALASRDCDIRDRAMVDAVLERECPDVVINAAAYTAVDKAESEPELAFQVNEVGPRNLAAASGKARLLHVSTDFVFSGNKNRPWRTDDAPAPLGVYGRSKLAGEDPVLARGSTGLVLRTSWVYSVFGNNFVKTMLRLMGSRPEVKVVADQTGAPTWAASLADALWHAAAKPQVHGLHHWCDSGVASWFDFAVAIEAQGRAAGLLTTPVSVLPIATAQYPTPARRPAYSLLDCTETRNQLGLVPPDWRENLQRMLTQLTTQPHG